MQNLSAVRTAVFSVPVMSERMTACTTLALPRSASWPPSLLLYDTFELLSQISRGSEEPRNEKDNEGPMCVLGFCDFCELEKEREICFHGCLLLRLLKNSPNKRASSAASDSDVETVELLFQKHAQQTANTRNKADFSPTLFPFDTSHSGHNRN